MLKQDITRYKNEISYMFCMECKTMVHVHSHFICIELYSHIDPVHLGLEHSEWVAVGCGGHSLQVLGLYVEAADTAALPLTPVQHLPVGVVQGQSGHVGSGQFQQDFPVCSIQGGLLYFHTATVHPYHGAKIHNYSNLILLCFKIHVHVYV